VITGGALVASHPSNHSVMVLIKEAPSLQKKFKSLRKRTTPFAPVSNLEMVPSVTGLIPNFDA
jgi:hypothetical protein